ncbi:MAG: GNAT family N-acetyltransferase [Lachnospiraceae bacterium]
MKEIPIHQGSVLAPFFVDAYDNCPEAYLQGFMGRGFSDSITEPTYGVIQVGDFCYFGGNGAGPLKQNVVHILKSLCNSPNMTLVPLSNSWNQTLSEIKGFERVMRYAMDKPDENRFNKRKLEEYVQRAAFDPQYVGTDTSRKFVMKQIDSFTYSTLPKEDWSKDLVANYHTYVEFAQRGLGFLIFEGATGKVVAGVSTFSSSKDSYEIQIATHPEYEGRGFATGLAARFILECLKLGKRPTWDAANLISVHIAENLGYRFAEEYVAYKRIL